MPDTKSSSYFDPEIPFLKRLGLEESVTLQLQSQFPFLIGLGLQKDHLHYMFVENSNNKHLGRFMKLYPVGNVIY